MVTALLREATSPPQLPIEWCRALVRTARHEAQEASRRIRRRACESCKRIRERSRRQGYQDGLLAARSEIARAISAIREQYTNAITQGERDSVRLAYHLAELVLQRNIEQKPELFANYLAKALDILRRGRKFHLSYHPRYENTITQAALVLPPETTLQADPSLTNVEFRLTSDEGAVESAWREALQELDLDDLCTS